LFALLEPNSFNAQATYQMSLSSAFGLKEKARLQKPAKMVLRCWVFFITCVFALTPIISALAENDKKDPETKQRLETVEEIEEEEKKDEESQTFEQIFGEKIRLNGGVELNYEYLDVNDADDKDSGSSSDFFVSTAELALRFFFNEWSKTKVVVAAEDVGREGGNGQVRLDEAIVTLDYRRVPLYLIGGKTVMPFGVFEDHLIEGTLTEDLYEIDDLGAIIGFTPEFLGLDISFSVYEDPQIINNLNDFQKGLYRSRHRTDEKFKSFIANVTLEPVEDALFLSAYFDSEPGDGNRNESIGGAFTLNYWKFTLDTEYIAALKREKGENGKENKESAGIVGLAFDVTDELELATRYAFFHDDNPGDQDEVLDYRIVAGFNYSLLELVNFSYLELATLSFEYRFSKYEKENDSDAANSQNMFQFQLTLGF
jgi:hypothetical protein